jgi:hypothetical protein
MDKNDNKFGISRSSGVIISLAAIAFAALLVLAVATVLPSVRDDVIGVLIASAIIPVIALFKPLQEFIVLPDGLGFSNIFSKRVYKVLWMDVTDVRLKRDVFGITNLEFQKKGGMYKKVPLSVIPDSGELLRQLLESFPPDHAKRVLLEHIISSYVR